MRGGNVICEACARRCGVPRGLSASSGAVGFCGVGRLPVVSRAAPHMWEEPCISGSRGSGAVFFAGCSLRCAYCQNSSISAGCEGREITPARLGEIFRELVGQGVHNINLVTPSHVSEAILEALPEAPGVPVVWNTGGYDSVETLHGLEGRVQVYLADMKYSDSALAARLSAAPDYPEAAARAIGEMFRQTGPYELDGEGLMTRGVIIRHLVLPGQLENTFGVLDWIRETFPAGAVMVSLMSQYTPLGRAADCPGLDRRLTREEYARAEEYMKALGILCGYTQDFDSADAAYVPPFDGTGV